MAFRIGSIEVGVDVNLKDFRKGLGIARTGVQKFGAGLRGLAGPLKAASVATAAAGGAIAAGIAIVTRAAGKEEEAISSLTVALKNQGVTTKDALDEQLAFASALQNTTTFGNETIIPMQALLASFGLIGDELKNATKTTLDFAQSQGIDLKAAAQLVGKAFVGETGSLSRYGIVIDKSIPKTEKFGAVLETLNKRFGGAAEAQRQTFLGQITALQNSFGDLLEQIGFAFLPVLKEMSINIEQQISAFLNNEAAVTDLKNSLAGFAKGVGVVADFVLRTALRLRTMGTDLQTVKTAIVEAIPFSDELGRSFRAIGRAAETTAGFFKNLISEETRENELAAQRIEFDRLRAETEARKREEIVATGMVERESITLLAQKELEKSQASILQTQMEAETQVLADEKEKASAAAKTAAAIQNAERQAEAEATSASFVANLRETFAKDEIARLAAIEQVSVRTANTAEQAFTDSFTKLALEGGSAFEALQEGARNFGKIIVREAISQIIRLIVKMIILKALKTALGFSAGGFITPQEENVFLARSAVGVKKGGMIPKFQGGGRVRGPRTGDQVPALLQGGEFVIPRRIVDFFRSNGFPPAAIPGGGPMSVQVVVTGNTIDSTGRADEIANRVKDGVMSVLMRQSRLVT